MEKKFEAKRPYLEAEARLNISIAKWFSEYMTEEPVNNQQSNCCESSSNSSPSPVSPQQENSLPSLPQLLQLSDVLPSPSPEQEQPFMSEDSDDVFDSAVPLPTLSQSPTSNPVVTDNEYEQVSEELVTRIQKERRRLLTIFHRRRITLNGQKDLMEFMRNAHPSTLSGLPKDGRTMRPPTIPYILCELKPGQLVYFGIVNVLKTSLIKLYDTEETTIRLSINIDGLPLFHSSGIGFWPILAAVDEKDVFVVGAYSGEGKPKCSNEYLRMLVDEICLLRKDGIKLEGKTYRFVLYNLIMDAPAKAYILGTVSHNAKTPCQKCVVVGVRVDRKGLASTKKKKKTALSYYDIDAPPRKHSDYISYPDNVPVCDSKAECDCKHISLPVVHYDSDSSDENFGDEEEGHEAVSVSRQNEKFFKHQTILTSITSFDLVLDVPLDYLHLICVGVVKKFIGIWLNNGCVLSEKNLAIANKRLLRAREYCPYEFQRKPTVFLPQKNWKATQFRQFLFYIGVAIIDGLMNSKKYMHNFLYLVVAMRTMASKVPQGPSRQNIINSRSDLARQLLRFFVKDSVRLYGPEVVTYNLHNVIHAPDDYQRFGEMDRYSAFRFESKLGGIKRDISSGYEPLKQSINKVSRHLQVNDSTARDADSASDVDAYYEQPLLRARQIELYESEDEEIQLRHIISEGQYDSFLEVKFRDFTLRTDNKANQHCTFRVDNLLHRVCITKIVQHQGNKNVYFIGRQYEEIRNVFDVPCESESIEMVYCKKLSKNYFMYSLTQLDKKCYAFPVIPDEGGYWYIASFNH